MMEFPRTRVWTYRESRDTVHFDDLQKTGMDLRSFIDHRNREFEAAYDPTDCHDSNETHEVFIHEFTVRIPEVKDRCL